MPGHSRSKNGVLSHAYVPGIHALRTCVEKDVDGRNKSGHDEMGIIRLQYTPLIPAKAGIHGNAHGASKTRVNALMVRRRRA